jgi:hypothetical protein
MERGSIRSVCLAARLPSILDFDLIATVGSFGDCHPMLLRQLLNAASFYRTSQRFRAKPIEFAETEHSMS